jgi:SAM-dependent methyltransferase
MRARYRLFIRPVETVCGLWYHYRAVAFDRWHGIETGKAHLRVRYDPTEPKYIRWAFRNLKIDPREYSFVDFGSGKGRVLIAAAELPFLRVMGVEYSEELHEAALRNIRSATRIKCPDVASILMDATEFSIPESPCVLFFYNPFPAQTMECVLRNTLASLRRVPRPIFVIFANPTLKYLFLQQPGMRLIRSRHWCDLYFWAAEPTVPSTRPEAA